MSDGCVKVDKELISLVEFKLNLPVEEIVEDYLKALIYYDDEESQLIKDFVKTNQKMDKLKVKLVKQLEAKELSYDTKLLEKPFKSLERINESLGYVGRNQISSIAKVNHVKASSLEALCIENEINVVEHAAGVK
ncbi:hypothetical protein MARBORIA2_14620 [Methanobrevibacter arboriphilus]|jgi:hypothetical protein|uniref:hypothetical protein n=1 Tax=Methanobrevibacter arboriphilus TaxID=39441 RepID=UPI0022EE945A|nr:hypothetical protein [Methanobrevibacter arboriphilus]GLI12372.1 hypothetical protein MARBORIA2_14620 [Methanobrevibacter arboriphilus]